jgi:hypothetical protein
MSRLYEVRVDERIDERTVVLAIQVVHPDSMYLCDSSGFALMLL